MRPHTCPRCGEGIPNNLDRGRYPGALSRTDNKTEICSECGTQEALEDWVGSLMPRAEWLITK
jgi:ribosomal protein S27AE